MTAWHRNENFAEEIAADIVNKYFSEFMTLQTKMESFVITANGRTVGRIVPIETSLDEKLAALQQAGLIRWNGKKLKPMKPLAALPEGCSLSDLIIEDRR